MSPLFFYKRTYLIPIITLGAGAISVALNIWAIPIWGITGAAWVTVFSYFLTFVITEALARKTFPLIYPWKKIAFTSVLAILLLVAVYLLKNVMFFPYPVVFAFSALSLPVFLLISLLLLDRSILGKIFDKAVRHGK